MSDIDTVVMDSLKVLDPNRPIREADIGRPHEIVRLDTAGITNCNGHIALQHSLTMYRFQTIALVLQKWPRRL